MDNELIKSYIKGSFINVNHVDQVCHTLAAEGSHIVLPTFRTTLPVLKQWGGELALIFMKPSNWPLKPASEYAANKTKQAVELEAGEAIDSIYYRVNNLVTEIAGSSSQHGEMVGEQMLLALANSDEDIRALATVHSTDDGIPSHVVSDSLMRLLFHDDDPLTRIGAALAVFGLSNIPDRILSEAAEHIMEFLEGGIFKAFPELVRRVRSNCHNQDESYQNAIIATLAVYRMIAYRSFDKGSGRSASASFDFARFPRTP